ncbi:uncharacterized protein NPIL_427781 [Nephila pilipes]|uniref:Uncharacterized protein n=1 Tax=Nephila pilipes TaxID=299642 RepID=A0A8X6P903_NEPPI|nr:uncharacterized protein NPIL_427781 [Nephila pilipes]
MGEQWGSTLEKNRPVFYLKCHCFIVTVRTAFHIIKHNGRRSMLTVGHGSSAFREFVLCKYIYVAQDCGHDADEFLQEHLDRITSPLLHEHCAHYTYGDGTCTSVANNLRPPLIPLLILTLSFSLGRILQRFSTPDAVNG